jgi:hypothetical protein
MEAEMQARMAQVQAQQRQSMFGLGAGLGALAGLGQAAGLQQQHQAPSPPDLPYRGSIKYKPTIEAGDPIREVLQAETDEWLDF